MSDSDDIPRVGSVVVCSSVSFDKIMAAKKQRTVDKRAYMVRRIYSNMYNIDFSTGVTIGFCFFMG